MVNIVRPTGQPQQGRAGVNQSLAATAGSGVGAVGAAIESAGRAVQQLDPSAGQRNVGKIVEAESAKYFKETQAAHQSAMLSNSMNEAMQVFTAQQQERMARVTDEKGNPTFTTLTQDIGKIGKDVADNIAKNISDSTVASQFKLRFNDYLGRQQVLSMKEARKQQVGFARSSLTRGLETLVQQGTNDDISNLEAYIGQGQQALNTALASGAISPQEHGQMTDRFAEQTRVGAYQRLIDNNSQGANALLKNGAQALGISDESHSRLERTLDAKVRADEIAAKKAQAALEREQKNKESLLMQDLEIAMESGALREDEMLKMEDQLSPKAFRKLKLKFIRNAKKEAKQRTRLGEVSDRIANGQSTVDLSTSVINDHYSQQVDSMKREKDVRLQDKAKIAKAYDRGVTQYAKEVNQSMLYGKSSEAAEAIRAYTLSRDMDSRALDGRTFTNQARDVAEYAELLNESGNMSLEEAVEIARDKVMNSTDPVRKERRKEFNKLSDFKLENLEDTVADAVGAEGWFGINKAVAQETQATFKAFAEEAYESTGDKQAALKVAATRMKETHGLSAFNGDDEYMFAPIEKMYPNVPVDRMRQQMVQDITPLLPAGQSNLDDVRIYSDRVSRGNFVNVKDSTGQTRKVELISYGIQYKKEIAPGVFTDVPLVNPKTGELVRWFPDVGKIVGEVAAEQEQQRATDVQKAAEKDATERQIQQLGVDPAYNTLFGTTR